MIKLEPFSVLDLDLISTMGCVLCTICDWMILCADYRSVSVFTWFVFL